MFKNKHVILAMIVAPILAIIAYFGIDLAVSEKPLAAKEGETYKLAARSNCRYTSGLCAMVNGDFKIELRSETLTENAVILKLTSDFPLEGAKISLMQNQEQAGSPINMEKNNASGKEWMVDLPAPTTEESRLQLVVKSQGTLYYGEAPTTFVEYKTFFTEEQQSQ
ncbi:hypothetical protein [Enterovibrio nigricans]|uniref:Uncharacterized protein n=1 Tax=Enterovibrio nigricans DSM 22720 TaxID=1121868 RepID=A0A1T4V978_9GAMM|nr:hypothetical protein [Enterovibrio nigricans]SKA61530.1 hypothetical protein SAMN02745132_03493 [Enterovibrio nigricans DSM 22720]